MSHDSGNSRASSVYSSHTIGGTMLSTTYNTSLRTRHLKLLHPFFISIDTSYPSFFTRIRVAIELLQWSAMLLIPTYTMLSQTGIGIRQGEASAGGAAPIITASTAPTRASEPFGVMAPTGSLAWGPVMSYIAIPIHYLILPFWEGDNMYGRINDFRYYSIIAWSVMFVIFSVCVAMLCKIFFASTREFARSSAVIDGCVHLLHFMTSVAFQPFMHALLSFLVCDNSAAARLFMNGKNANGVLSAFRRLDSQANSNGSRENVVLGSNLPQASIFDISHVPSSFPYDPSTVVGCLEKPYPIVLFTFSLIAAFLLLLFKFTTLLFVTDSVPKSNYLFARPHGAFECFKLGANVLMMVLYHYLLMGTGHRLLFTALFAIASLFIAVSTAFFLPYFSQKMNQLMCGSFLALCFIAVQQTITLTNRVLREVAKSWNDNTLISSTTSQPLADTHFFDTTILASETTTLAFNYIFGNWDACVAFVGGLLAFTFGYVVLANIRVSRQWLECISLAKDGIPPMPTTLDPVFVFPSHLPDYELHAYRGIEKRILAEERYRRTKEEHVRVQKEQRILQQQMQRHQKQRQQHHSSSANGKSTKESSASSHRKDKAGQDQQSNTNNANAAGSRGASVANGILSAKKGRTGTAKSKASSSLLGENISAEAQAINRKILESQLAWAGETNRIHSNKLYTDQMKAEELWIAYPFISSVLVATDVEVAARGITNFLKATGLWPPIIMLAFTVRIYTKGLTKYVWNNWLEIQFLTFLSSFVPSMNGTALGIAESILKRDLSYVEMFEAQRRLGQIGQSLLIRDNVTKKAFISAQKLHKEALQHMKLFWSRLLLDHVDIVRLGHLAKVITDKRAEGFQQYLRVQSDTSDQQSMLRFAQFLEQVMLDHASAQACREVLVEGLEQERIANGGETPIDVSPEDDGTEEVGGGVGGVAFDTNNANKMRSKRENSVERGTSKPDNAAGRNAALGFDEDDSVLQTSGKSRREKSRVIATLSININIIFTILTLVVIALFACGFVMHADRQETIDRVDQSGKARYLTQEIAALVSKLANPLTEASKIPPTRATLQRRLSTLRDHVSTLSFGDLRSSDSGVQLLYSLPLQALRYVTGGPDSPSLAPIVASTSSDTDASATTTMGNGLSSTVAGGGQSTHLAGGLLLTTTALIAAVEQFLRSLDMVTLADGGYAWTVSTIDNGIDTSKTSFQDLDPSAALSSLIASLGSSGTTAGVTTVTTPSAATSSSSSATGTTNDDKTTSASHQQVSAERNKAIANEMRGIAATFMRANAWLSVASAFNESVTVYVEDGHTILRRSQLITSGLFVLAILVIIAVNFVIVFNLKKISATKMSTLGLFTLIPRNALERLRDEANDWMEHFDDPDRTFQQLKAERGLEDDDDVRRRIMMEEDPSAANFSSAATAAANHNMLMMNMQQQYYNAMMLGGGGGGGVVGGDNGMVMMPHHPTPMDAKGNPIPFDPQVAAEFYHQQQQQQQQNNSSNPNVMNGSPNNPMSPFSFSGGSFSSSQQSPFKPHFVAPPSTTLPPNFNMNANGTVADNSYNAALMMSILQQQQQLGNGSSNMNAGANSNATMNINVTDNNNNDTDEDNILEDTIGNKLYNRLLLRGDLAAADTGASHLNHHHHNTNGSMVGTSVAVPMVPPGLAPPSMINPSSAAAMMIAASVGNNSAAAARHQQQQQLIVSPLARNAGVASFGPIETRRGGEQKSNNNPSATTSPSLSSKLSQQQGSRPISAVGGRGDKSKVTLIDSANVGSNSAANSSAFAKANSGKLSVSAFGTTTSTASDVNYNTVVGGWRSSVVGGGNAAMMHANYVMMMGSLSSSGYNNSAYPPRPMTPMDPSAVAYFQQQQRQQQHQQQAMGRHITYFNGYGYDEDAVVDADLKAIEASAGKHSRNAYNSRGGGGGFENARSNSLQHTDHNGRNFSVDSNSFRRNSSGRNYSYSGGGRNDSGGDGSGGGFGGDADDLEYLLENHLRNGSTDVRMTPATAAAAVARGDGLRKNANASMVGGAAANTSVSDFHRQYSNKGIGEDGVSGSRRRRSKGAFAFISAFFSGGGGSDDDGSGEGLDANATVYRYISQSSWEIIIAVLGIACLLFAIALVTLFSVTLVQTDKNVDEIILCEQALEQTVQMIDARRELHRVTERFVMRLQLQDSKDVNNMHEARRYDLSAAKLRESLQQLQHSKRLSSSMTPSVSGHTVSSSSGIQTASSASSTSSRTLATYIGSLVDTHEDLWARIQVIQNAARVLACSTDASLDCEHFPQASWDRRQFIDRAIVDEFVTSVNTFVKPKPIPTRPAVATAVLPRSPNFVTVENYSYWLPRNETFDMKLTRNKRLATARAALANPLYYQWFQESLTHLSTILAELSSRAKRALVKGSSNTAHLVETTIALSAVLVVVSLITFSLLRFSSSSFQYTRHALSVTALVALLSMILGAIGLTYFPVINQEGAVMLNVINLWNESLAANEDLLSHARRAALFKDAVSLRVFGARMMERQYDMLWGEFAATMSDETLPDVQTCVVDSRNAFFLEAIAVTLAANMFNISERRIPPILNSFVWNASADVNAIRFVLENPSQKMFSDRPSDMARNETDKRELIQELLLGPIRQASFERSNTACRNAVTATSASKADAVVRSRDLLFAFLVTCIVLSSMSTVLLLLFLGSIVKYKYEAIANSIIKTRDDRVVRGEDEVFNIMTRRARIALVALALLFFALFIFNILEIESALPHIRNQNIASLREFEMYRSLALSSLNNENRSAFRSMAEASGIASMDAALAFYRGEGVSLSGRGTPMSASGSVHLERSNLGKEKTLDVKLFGPIRGVPMSFECVSGFTDGLTSLDRSSSSASNFVEDASTSRSSSSVLIGSNGRVVIDVLPQWSSTVPSLIARGVDLAQRRWRDEIISLARGGHTAASVQMIDTLHSAADTLGPAIHATTVQYADYSRDKAYGGLIGYMVLWALIAIVIIYEYVFVFRPIIAQLMAEEEGTKVMLKMIPLDVRERVPAIAEYLETGIVVQDVKVHEINDAAIDLSTVPIISIDFDGTILTFSKAAEQCFFWTKEEVIGKNVRMLMPEDIASEHDSYLAAYRRTGVKHIIGNVLKTRAIRRNGVTFPAEISVKEIHRGRSTTFIGTIRDVGQEMEVEKAMAVSTAISDAAAIPIIVIDKKGVILRFNHAARQTFRTEGSMVGRRVNELMPANVAALHDGYIAKYMLHRIKNVIDKSRVLQGVRVNTGEVFPIRVTVKEYKGAMGGAVVGSNRDVQFIGYVEDLTRQVGQRLATMISDAIPITSPVPYVETNSDGIITTFSPAAEQLFGYSCAEVYGRNVSILMPPDMADKHSTFIRNYHETGVKRMLDTTTLQYAQKRTDDGKRFVTIPVRISVKELSTILPAAGSGGGLLFGGGGGAAASNSVRSLSTEDGTSNALAASSFNPMVVSGDNTNGLRGILSSNMSIEGTNGSSRFVAFIEDISDERQLEKENMVTARLTAMSPTPLIVTDVYGRILTFPTSAEKAFGYTAAEAVGMDATRLLGPIDYQFTAEAFTVKDSKSGGRSMMSGGANRKVLIKPKEGKSFYTELLIKPVMGGTYYVPPPPPPVQLSAATATATAAANSTMQQQQPLMGSHHAADTFMTAMMGAGSGGGPLSPDQFQLQAAATLNNSTNFMSTTLGNGDGGTINNSSILSGNAAAQATMLRQYRTQVQQHFQTQKYRQFQQIRLVAIFRTALADQVESPGLGPYTESISRLATTPLVWIDWRGIILGCSDSTIERFQWARDELIGQNVSLLMPDSIASKHDEYLFNYRQRLAAKGKEEAARNSIVIGKDRRVLAKTRDEQVFTASLLVKDIHIGSLDPVFVGYIRDLTSEMELATQKHLSATIIQSSFIPIICIDQSGLIQEFSSAAETVFGYSRHEMLNENVKILMPDHIARSHDGYLKAYAKTGIKAIIDSKRPVTALRRDKTEFQAELMVKEVTHKDAFGKDTTEYIGYIKDLSYQTILDQATRINELVASLSAVPILIINPRGVIMECNPATEIDFGYANGELIGKNVKILMTDDIASEHDTYLSRYRATRVKKIIDNTRVVRAMRKDRSTFPAELSVREVRRIDGSEGQFIGYIRNVTVEQQIAATNYINTTMMDLSPVPCLVVDHLGIVQHYSRAAAQVFEYPVKAVVGKNVKMLMPDDVAAQHDLYLQRYLVTKKQHIIGSTRRVTAKRASGRVFPVELNIREVFDEQLQVPVYVGFIHDLSEQAEVEALSAFSEMVNVLSPVPVISINHEGTVIRFSASAEQEFKVSASEIIGKNVKLLQPPEVAEHHDMYLQRYSITKIKHVIDNTRATVAKRWDNTTFRASLYVKEVTDSDHEFPLFVGYIKNIEEDNRIEEASKENAAMQLLAPLPVFVITRNGIVLDVNPAVETVFGYHQSEVKGSNISIIMPPHIASQHDEYLRKYHQTGVKHVIDQIRVTQGKRKDGTVIPIEISIREVKVPGMETQYVGYVKDTSMSQRMVESLAWNEAIISLAATPLVVIDPDGLIMKFTKEAEKLFQYSASEVIGKNVKLLMPPEIARKHDRYIEKYHISRIKTVIDHNRRVKGKKKNGEIFLCELGVREILNEDDTMTEAFAGYIRPIATDHNSLIEGSAEINGMMHAVSLHGVIIIDEVGIIEKANPAVAEMFGVHEATLIGKNVKMLMPEDIASKHDQYLANYLVSGVKRVIDTKRVTYGKNITTQATFPMELSVKELNDIKSAAMASDTEAHSPLSPRLTRRRYLGCIRMIQHEVQIERQRTLNKHTLDLSMSGTIVSNHRGGIIMFSHVAEKLFGCRSEQIVGKVNISDLMPNLTQQLEGADFLSAYRRGVNSASNQQHLIQRNPAFAHHIAMMTAAQQQQQGGGGYENLNRFNVPGFASASSAAVGYDANGQPSAFDPYHGIGSGNPIPYLSSNNNNNGGQLGSSLSFSYLSRTVTARRVDSGEELTVNIFIRELYFKTVPGAEPHFVTYVDPVLVDESLQAANNANNGPPAANGSVMVAPQQ